ncbi:hypothetical protein R3P38DRAFT_2966175 [Favolaschia claudopus]|uniref:Uncharacterized protein n=1 Tax=Favolaschia claudopus TaxID=2862362 RepID=A0AAW0B725_9AGAR
MRSPHITRLELSYLDIFEQNPDGLIIMLRTMMNLTHLEIGNTVGCWSPATCRALTYEDGVPPLVPLLHHLIITELEYDASRDLVEPLDTLINSRYWTDAQLASRAFPPAVARWTQIRIENSVIHFTGEKMERRTYRNPLLQLCDVFLKARRAKDVCEK